MVIGTIFAGLNFGKELAGCLGLIETLSAKIEKLGGSELEAGMRALEQASSSETETKSLLREARLRFNKAISLEKNERLAAAHIGLAFCHRNLGDRKNTFTTLQQLEHIHIDEPVKRAVMVYAEDTIKGGPILGSLIGHVVRKLTDTKPLADLYFDARKKKLEELKQSVRVYLDDIT